MTSTNRTLVIMAKAPRLGCVKTRLAESLSLEAVTELYLCLLSDTLALAHSLSGVEIAIMCPAADVEELSRALGTRTQIVPQKGEGLAAGLASVFAQFATTDHTRVVAFSSDSPHLSPSVLQTAFDALDTHDLVVGPTHDGGYYLVGARASHPDLFINEAMGTTNAFRALLSRARVLGLSINLTDSFYDIDVAADLTRLATDLQRAPGKAPSTSKWLSDRIKSRAASEGSP